MIICDVFLLEFIVLKINLLFQLCVSIVYFISDYIFYIYVRKIKEHKIITLEVDELINFGSNTFHFQLRSEGGYYEDVHNNKNKCHVYYVLI